ncbi:MAG TPA: signal recognition particle protein [bacterium]|nr:signal recognition particle protein [bacterium]
MFDALTDRFGQLRRKLLGFGRLTNTEISQALREVRTVLLEADVNYKVVGHFIRSVEARLKEKDVAASLKPGELINATLYQELVQLLGGTTPKLDLSANPSVISLVGLQGTGKTTFAGKLAYKLRNRRPLLVACDPKRPAASEQLRSVAERAKCDFYPVADDVVATCLSALKQASDRGNGIVVFDTAGRLHIEDELMDVLASIQDRAKPTASLLVLDGMVGQDAVSQAEQFNARLKLTGCCFTKLDGDARGGAVMSVRQVTGLPVLFVGTGEHLEDLEEFHPDRIASRILGMGDLKSLADKVQAATEGQDQRAIAEKFLKGKFDLDDFLSQLKSVKKMGNVSKLLAMIPGAGNVEIDDHEFVQVEAIIQSMTWSERHNPDIVDGSRRRRIAAGSGTTVTDVNRLLKEFDQARVLAKQMSGGRGQRLRLR